MIPSRDKHRPAARRWSPFGMFVAALILLVTPGARASDSLGIVPTPQRIEYRGGAVLVTETTPIVIGENSPEDIQFAAKWLQQSLREKLQQTLPILVEANPEETAGKILLGDPDRDPAVAKLMRDYNLSFDGISSPEGYVLGVGEAGIVIAGRPTDRIKTGRWRYPGVYYGAVSLEQMLVARGPRQPLAGVRIHDWPTMAMRGIHDEISYGQVSTMENFADIFRFTAYHKMNTVFIYLEDIYRFDRYPTIGVGRGALTKQQVAQLHALADPLHIELIPIFEMLGNQGALLMLDEVRPYAEFPGAHSFSVDDDAFGFLKNCFEELTAVFPSRYFHAGLDESWDLGFGKTEQRVAKEGRGPVHAAHYKRLHELFRAKDRTMVMYADIILNRPEILDLIPKDIVLMDWHYEPDPHFPSVRQLAQAGFPLLVLPGVNNWDRIFPMTSAASCNIRNFTRDAVEVGGLGSIVSTWGDNGSKNFRELNYYAYGYGGEVSWSPQSADMGSFARRFFTLRNGRDSSSQFEAIYALLEKWPGWYPLLDYFRHPFLPRKDEKNLTEQELFRLDEDARVALELADELQHRVDRRRGDVDYLRFCAQSHRHYAQCQRLVRELNAFGVLGENPAPARSAAAAQFVNEIRAVRSETIELRDRFRELWLRTNLEANLHYAIDEYDRLIAVWDDAEQRALQGQFAFDPRPAAHWIYHPAGFEANKAVQQGYFRKQLEIDPRRLQQAGLQVHGDTHVKIYVNGELVGEQFARRNLSAPVNPQLVRLYDILPLLRPGKNAIAVEAHCYGSENAELEPGGPARCGGFHLSGRLLDNEKNAVWFGSDDQWKVSDQEHANWTSADFDDAAWPTARPDPKPTVWVTVPDFDRGIPGFSDMR